MLLRGECQSEPAPLGIARPRCPFQVETQKLEAVGKKSFTTEKRHRDFPSNLSWAIKPIKWVVFVSGLAKLSGSLCDLVAVAYHHKK